MRYLGLDLGSKNLGVSISDITNTIASNLETIRYSEDNYEEALRKLEPVIKDNNITNIILGYPKNMNNTIGSRALLTKEFKERLEKLYRIKVILFDERLTSSISNSLLISSNVSRKKRKKVVDKMAANIILQDYLDLQKRRT